MALYIDGVKLDELTSDPGTPEEGQIWYNTSDNRFKVYVNATIEEVAHRSDLEAGNVVVNASGFTGILSSLAPGPTDVQTALDTIDQRIFTGTATPTGASGRLWYNTTAGWNCLMAYDSSRTKWLSTAEFVLGWGHDSPDNQYLNGYGITVVGANGGLLIPRNCCVKRISARCNGGNTTKRLDLYVNGASVLNFSLATSGGFGVYSSNTVNQNLAENDYVWLWADAAGVAPTDVVALLWCSWRV